MNIDISSIANWSGAIAGVLTLIAWAWKAIHFYHRMAEQLRMEALQWTAKAVALSSKATNAERRADIHTYFVLQKIDVVERRRSWDSMLSRTATFLVLLVLLALLPFRTSPSITISTWLDWLLVLLIASMIIFIVILLWLGRRLTAFERKWEISVNEYFDRKLSNHSEA